MIRIMILLTLLPPIPALAQHDPNGPSKENFALLLPIPVPARHDRNGPSKEDFALIAADASVRAMDVYSTHWMLANGDREVLLPDVIAQHTPAMAAYSAGVVATDWFLMRRLESRHPRLAHAAMLVEIGQDGYFAAHNFFLRKGSFSN